MNDREIKIRECKKLSELKDCVDLQRKVFALPEIELSPVRHLIVTNNAGGFTLGAFHKDRLVGFSLSVAAILYGEKAFYSHMTAVDQDFQSFGIGAKLKWEQRKTSLAKGVRFIKWTFQPVLARNAYFNFEKLGAIVKAYKPNFYGTDYSVTSNQSEKLGFESDRIIAEWHLESEKVKALANNEKYLEKREIQQKIKIPNDWNSLLKSNPQQAIEEQKRIKKEFQKSFADNLITIGFERSESAPSFLLVASQ